MNFVVTNTVTNTRTNSAASHSRLPKIYSALHGTLAVALFSALLVCAAHPAQAQYETLLYNFPEGPYGEVQGPEAPLTPDGAGNFYGTTVGYGSSDNGTVFEVLPNGSYYEAMILSFPGGAGGSYPGYSPVAFDKLGNLYGTTSYGRISNGQQGNGVGGAVFELSKSGGDWTETLLYTFPYGALSGTSKPTAVTWAGLEVLAIFALGAIGSPSVLVPSRRDSTGSSFVYIAAFRPNIRCHCLGYSPQSAGPRKLAPQIRNREVLKRHRFSAD